MIFRIFLSVGISVLLILSEHKANSQGDSREIINYGKGLKGLTTTIAPTTTISTTIQPPQLAPHPPPLLPQASTPPAPRPTAPLLTTPRPTAPRPTTPRPTPPRLTTPRLTTPRPTPPRPTPPRPTPPRPTPPRLTTPRLTTPRPTAPKPTATHYHARQYMGCYTDKANSRAMASFSLPHQTITIDSCKNNCYSHGFKFSGTEYGYECFCSNQLPNTATYPKRPDSQCNTKCWGNRNQNCGGRLGISIYATGKQ